MRIGLQTWGSEGDLRPFYALANELASRGHEVRLVTTNVEGRDLKAFAAPSVAVTDVGTAWFLQRQVELQAGAKALMQLRNPLVQFERIVVETMDPVNEAMLRAGRELAAWADFVVVHVVAHAGVTAAQAERKPFGLLAFAPMFPTRAYPPMTAPSLGPGNRLLWWLAARAMDRILAGRINQLRAHVALPPVHRPSTAVTAQAGLVLLAMSPALLPRPADWPGHFHVTGFLELAGPAQFASASASLAKDESHTSAPPTALPTMLEAFLQAGPPPALFTVGSMANIEPTRAVVLAHAAIAAARANGLRCVVQLPAGAHDAVRSSDVCAFAHAPHAQLFPRCALLMHHGGAGTTHAAMRAGRPAIHLPHLADQYYWGKLAAARGVAAAPLPASEVTERRLTQRVASVVNHSAMAERARALAAVVAAEHGPQMACEAIERTRLA